MNVFVPRGTGSTGLATLCRTFGAIDQYGSFDHALTDMAND